MPKFKTGDMFSVFNEADIFLITTNSTIKANGTLVMGAGIAKEARDRWKGLDAIAGEMVMSECGNRGTYGLMLSNWRNGKKLGLFQVKIGWDENADVELIKLSTEKLIRFAEEHPELKIHLNYPGIGNGKLSVDDVHPIICSLPNNVTIWSLE